MEKNVVTKGQPNLGTLSPAWSPPPVVRVRAKNDLFPLLRAHQCTIVQNSIISQHESFTFPRAQERVSEWICARAKRAERNKRKSEQFQWMSKRTSEWPLDSWLFWTIVFVHALRPLRVSLWLWFSNKRKKKRPKINSVDLNNTLLFTFYFSLFLFSVIFFFLWSFSISFSFSSTSSSISSSVSSSFLFSRSHVVSVLLILFVLINLPIRSSLYGL